MLKLTLTSCFLTSIVQSNLSKMDKTMQTVVSKHRIDSFMLGPDTHKIVSSFNNYGCWCILDRKTDLEKTDPMTKIDTFCRELKIEYQRIEQHFENFNNLKNSTNSTKKVSQKCDPYKTNYKNKGFSVEQDGGLDLQFKSGICERMNRADCAIQVCKAEMVFVRKLHDYIFFEEDDDRDAFGHENGFNVTKFC